MFTKMNNECIKSSKINASVPSTSTSCSYSNGNSSSTNTSVSNVTTSHSSLPSSPPASISYSANSTQFNVTASAIAAVVNASNHLPVTTPASAAAVVAVAVSSLAAAFIPDTAIVSIAGSTLSEITTTTTSTKTTPTPVPTSQEGGSNNNNFFSNKNHSHNNTVNNKYLEHNTSSPTREHHTSSSSTSVKDLNPMSIVNSSNTGVLTNALTTAANATTAAAETGNNSPKQTKNSFNTTTRKGAATVCSETVIKTDEDPLIITTDAKSFATTSPLPPSIQPFVVNANSPENVIEDINITSNKIKSKDLSEPWEESRLKDWDDSKLKELLDEAYSYKNPRDKENKSKTFLQLLEKAENEDQSYPFRVTSRGSRNLSSSITSNSYNHYQNAHYHSHSQNHNRSHHHHKQGGSLQDLFEIGLHESQLDCDQNFGIGISGNQRTRRQNHNSRQKKYSSSVSSRQREGGSLPSNVNVTINDIGFMQQEGGFGLKTGELQTTSLTSGKGNKKEQRRNVSKALSLSTSSSGSTETKDNNNINGAAECVITSDNTTTTSNTNFSYTDSSGDVTIDIEEPMMDIQQQQKILHSKGQDAATQRRPFYECLSNSDKRIPRANIIGSTKSTCFAPSTSHCYVDETLRFSALERNGGTNNSVTPSSIDAKFLPLDENYKSCKSVLGSDGDKTPEMLAKSKSSTNYAKISSPVVSSSAILSGSTNIAPLSQRQLDENGNALGEIQQNTCGVGSGSLVWKQLNSVSPSAANASAALLNSCGNVSTSATVTISPHTVSTTVSTSATVTTTLTSGPSQAKAKAKKKSQQERNTKTVDVESVAGYRGKDPVEELVKYIESSSEDKQGGGPGAKSGDKKKERKKDKEKHQKLKKSNSLEELRSGAKMEVHELKRTAATTESNTVLVRQKSGGGKQNKNNSSSTADINKNLDSKNQTQSGHSRKSDRRSWGNDDLKYLDDQQNANLTNEDKTLAPGTNSAKERRNKLSLLGVATSSRDEKEIKDKTNDRNERNLTNNMSSTIQNDEKSDKMEKPDKIEKTDNKTDKSEKRKKQEIPPNAVTVVDIQAIESALPETAEFHVVTKKKKPKKQKVINNLEETTVTFNRTHNFTMQKTSTFNQQQQQMTVRYKYYHHDNLNTTNASISNVNTNSQYHQHLSSQYQHNQQQQQPSSNYNSNAGMTNSHHQSQQTTDRFSNNDKSRRKSTSSVPPSEKSDSSDLDSVHSLPIESTKATNVSNTLKENTQLRTKVSKNNNNTALGNNNFTMCKSQNSPAPVSYADIARTNKEITDAAGSASASGILINNNEISIECRNADTITQNSQVTESFNDDKPSAVNTAMGVITASTSLLKPHKIKKSQIKQDFPELVGSSAISDDKIVNANINHKTITYSQSLTAVKPSSQNKASILSHGSGFNSANESSPSSSLDFNTKASPIELHKNAIVHQPANIPPLQHSQQLILQKSKSVENDSIALTNSSSSITYMASLNSNNLDQQYPALEKTVKRHSSSNVILNTNASSYCSLPAVNITNSATNQATFNFAAAAKQQIALSNNEQHNTNLNKNLALTTSNTNNTIQTALQPNTNFNVNAVGDNVNSGIIGNTVMTNKKSKEKISPLSNNSTQVLQNMSQDFNATNHINTNVTTLPTVATNSKKTKKERQLQQQHILLDNTQAKQNINNNNNVSSRKAPKLQLKSSTSLPLSVTTSSASASSSLASASVNTISINRPAVIILNDDRNSTSCTADNQFTFGDFNEDELRLFDDDNVTENPLESTNTNVISLEEEKHQQSANDAATKTSSISYFNDSGTSCGSDIVNNSTSDTLLSSSMETSSPNTSFATISHSVGEAGSNMSAPCNNQSSDSGIYIDKTKSSNIICNSSNSSSCENANTGSISSKHSKQQQMMLSNDDDNKLNTFLSNTRCTSVQTSIDNLEPPPPPQQLETCNDIETAIIAAARAAAKQQQPADYQLQQQQQYKNSNASSSSSSFSSSSLTSSSTSSAYHNYHQHHNNIKRNYQNQIGSGNILPSYPQSQQPQYEEDNEDDNESYIDMSRSRSPSRPRRISIAGGTIANKEFDIHFIPPTTMPTAFSTQQHNDIIIDFIGSAWEEVANSKVTKVYDGQ